MEKTTLEPQAKESLGKALGRLASGVYVVTLNVDGTPDGMMATWIAQASFEPPMLTISFNKERPILAAIHTGTAMTINVLSKQNMDIFKAFARAPKEGEDRFASLPTQPAKQGGPIFTGAIAYMEGVVRQLVDAGDHKIALVELTAGALSAEGEPMVHLRNHGFTY